MNRNRILIWLFICVLFAGLIAGIFLAIPKSKYTALESSSANVTFANLGFVFIPVTSRSSGNYPLGNSSGALVTEVIHNSLADQAGIKPGDIIIRYNNSMIGKETPLLGMMRTCNPGSRIQIEIDRGEIKKIVEIPCPKK